MHRWWLPGALVLLLLPAFGAQAQVVEVQGLFTGAAILKVNGQSKMLRVGQTFAGVTLVESTSRSATIEINGQRQVLGVSTRISSNYQVPETREVTIRRDGMMQYQTNALINGRRMRVLVDTGANLLVLNADHARVLGLASEAGDAVKVETAAGVVDGKILTLRSVEVGGIRVENVRAAVLMGSHPSTILLGMSYLRHVEMHESGGILSLSRAY